MGSFEEFYANKDENTLIGRHLHLTSNSPVGTKWEDGNLGHIDGAINVYFGEKVKERLSSHIDDGIDSNCRTHLFRIDNIPIKELLIIAKLFFNSIALVEEWEEEFFIKKTNLSN